MAEKNTAKPKSAEVVWFPPAYKGNGDERASYRITIEYTMTDNSHDGPEFTKSQLRDEAEDVWSAIRNDVENYDDGVISDAKVVIRALK